MFAKTRVHYYYDSKVSLREPLITDFNCVPAYFKGWIEYYCKAVYLSFKVLKVYLSYRVG